MPSRSVVIGSSVGLHARPAALFVQAATALGLPVTIAKEGGAPVSARSILSVLSLDARGGQTVVLAADGDGADDVLEQLVQVLAADHDSAEA